MEKNYFVQFQSREKFSIFDTKKVYINLYFLRYRCLKMTVGFRGGQYGVLHFFSYFASLNPERVFLRKKDDSLIVKQR